MSTSGIFTNLYELNKIIRPLLYINPMYYVLQGVIQLIDKEFDYDYTYSTCIIVLILFVFFENYYIYLFFIIGKNIYIIYY